MGVLIETPNVEHFGTLPDIDKAAKTFDSLDAVALVEEVGELFVKHGTFDQFGLVLVHRHFDLNEGEILVETFNKKGDVSVALPWNVKRDVAEPGDGSLMESYELNPGKWIVPQSWSFSADGETLVAYEFLSHPFELSPPPQDFVLELYEALRARGLQSLVGIRRLLNLSKQNSWETTPNGIRANVTLHGLVRPEGVPETGMITVVWAFNETGKLRNVSDCSGHCVAHNSCFHGITD